MDSKRRRCCRCWDAVISRQTSRLACSSVILSTRLALPKQVSRSLFMRMARERPRSLLLVLSFRRLS